MNDDHIAAGEFKARCLAILERVRQYRQPFVITKRGVPIARILPVEEDNVFEDLKKSVLREGDLIAPIDED
ncbi:MAG: type II toxin-antitoxin system Phd/YefM family antitoxin [Myxococcales bacterium]|nr:type II toxin-antitoxin system Phd/YefM family antitoxin [Myxococcales bacterium]MCB9707535.1 type II toxin-antitoxin system Phd/YefM family antitoxin [Myxococcales bacterium]